MFWSYSQLSPIYHWCYPCMRKNTSHSHNIKRNYHKGIKVRENPPKEKRFLPTGPAVFTAFASSVATFCTTFMPFTHYLHFDLWVRQLIQRLLSKIHFWWCVSVSTTLFEPIIDGQLTNPAAPRVRFIKYVGFDTIGWLFRILTFALFDKLSVNSLTRVFFS